MIHRLGQEERRPTIAPAEWRTDPRRCALARAVEILRYDGVGRRRPAPSPCTRRSFADSRDVPSTLRTAARASSVARRWSIAPASRPPRVPPRMSHALHARRSPSPRNSQTGPPDKPTRRAPHGAVRTAPDREPVQEGKPARTAAPVDNTECAAPPIRERWDQLAVARPSPGRRSTRRDQYRLA